MKAPVLLSIITAACLSLTAPATALQEHCPEMHEDPLGTLDDCLAHHQDELAYSGVFRSLLMKTVAAQEAAARGENEVAILILAAFIHEAEALIGIQISGEATHVVDHAEMAIAQLGG